MIKYSMIMLILIEKICTFKLLSFFINYFLKQQFLREKRCHLVENDTIFHYSMHVVVFTTACKPDPFRIWTHANKSASIVKFVRTREINGVFGKFFGCGFVF